MIEITFSFDEPTDERMRALLAINEILLQNTAEEIDFSISGIEMWGYILDAWEDALPNTFSLFLTLDRKPKLEDIAHKMLKMSKKITRELEQAND